MAGHEDALLTELCTICHEKPPKYRCPRCSIRTCSLPCTKRHKLWSQCSGIRDPAEYMKRTDLATPSAFDKDFNFITGIERGIERADRDTENREIDVGRDGSARRSGGNGVVKGGSAFQNKAASNGVKVVRAPKGMTRNKENLSFWNKKHRGLNWTVEWAFSDGQKTRMESAEKLTISTAYSNVLLKGRSKKRKLNTPYSHNDPRAPNSKLPRAQEEQAKSGSKVAQMDTQPTSVNTPTPSQPPSQQEENKDSTEKQTADSTKPKDEPPTQPHFYLHRPCTRSKLPVLIPISPDKTITETLRDRIVLEFPTIYVLTETPELVPREKFMLEEEYILKEREGLEVLDELSEEGGGEKSSQEEGEITESGPAQWDEKKVLEVLKKDLEGRAVRL